MRPRLAKLYEQAGIGLLELLLVLAIALAVVAWGLSAMKRANIQTSTLTDVSTQAQEMAQLADAALEYGNTLNKLLGAGTRFDASPSVLIAAHELASNFALRYGTVGTSPLGQTYHAAGIKDATSGLIQVVVWLDGAPRADQVAYINLPAGDAGNAQYAGQVSGALRSQQDRISATIAAGTTTAADTTGAFTIDVTALLVAAPTVTTPAVLKNFSTLGPTTLLPTPPVNAALCTVLMPTSPTLQPCATGQHAVASWPVCGTMNSYVPFPYSIFGTQAGIVTVGFHLRAVTFEQLPCFFGPLDSRCGGVGDPTEYHYDGVVLINNAPIHTDVDCGGTSWAYPCPTGGYTMCQVTLQNSTVQTYKAQAIAQLCCPG